MDTSDIVKKGKEEVSQSIESFSQPLANYISGLGSPTESIFSPIQDRKDIIENLDSALRGLEAEDRSKAFYLSKFTVAVSVGLFDGALNYLWNETVNNLRKKITDFDISYFYGVAGQFASRYKNYQGIDDLKNVDDADLLEACRRIGIISVINYDKLILINKMRNNASAAHPNKQEIDGFELLGWLRTCLNHVIGAKFELSVLYIQRFLDNFRKHSIPSEDVSNIQSEFDKLAPDQADDIAWSVFGMYCDPNSSEYVRRNTELLAVSIWRIASENRKFEIGAKFGYYRGTGDVQRRENAKNFLDLVDANRYKDEDSLTGELIEKLEGLKKIHFSANNFYNEYLPAKSLKDSLPTTGVVPRAARTLWVKVISLGFIGNGLGYREGVDESALPYYETYIDGFSIDEDRELLKMFADPEFYNNLSSQKTDSRARMLLLKVKNRTKSLEMLKVIETLEAAPSLKMPVIHLSSAYKSAISALKT